MRSMWTENILWVSFISNIYKQKRWESKWNVCYKKLENDFENISVKQEYEKYINIKENSGVHISPFSLCANLNSRVLGQEFCHCEAKSSFLIASLLEKGAFKDYFFSFDKSQLWPLFEELSNYWTIILRERYTYVPLTK